MNEKITHLQAIIKILGRNKVADCCEVTKEAVAKWMSVGYLPISEIFRQTDYATKILTLYKEKNVPGISCDIKLFRHDMTTLIEKKKKDKAKYKEKYENTYYSRYY